MIIFNILQLVIILPKLIILTAMRKSLPVFLFSFFLFSLILINSCRKLDQLEQKEHLQTTIEKEFFNIPDSLDARLLAVVQDIKKQDATHHFIADFSKNNGLPIWDKVVSNFTINYFSNDEVPSTSVANASSDNDNFLVFIPLRSSDGSIKTYIACFYKNGKYHYRTYKRHKLSKEHAATEEIRKFREAALSLFGFFEKTINNKDTIQVGGIFPDIITKVQITFKKHSTKKSNVSEEHLSEINDGYPTTDVVEVCYRVPCPNIQKPNTDNSNDIRSTVMVVMPTCNACYMRVVEGWVETPGGGDSGGTGGGDGGSTGGTGYNCPPDEWWCESGDYRIIEGILYTPESYPGIDRSMPWLWWEDDTWLSNPNNFNLDLDPEQTNEYGPLTAAEKFLVRTYPREALIIFNNKSIAEAQTVSKMGGNGLNDKSDAFRHAFFQAINTLSVGASLTQLFADAHESEVPAQLQKEKDMDLFNNSVGITTGQNMSFWTSVNTLADEILDKVITVN